MKVGGKVLELKTILQENELKINTLPLCILFLGKNFKKKNPTNLKDMF